MPRGLFLIGTDRGVGKTMVGVSIVAILREMGVDAVMMTPVSTGGSVESAAELLRSVGVEEDRRLVNPIAYETAAAPYVAGMVEHRPVDVSRVLDAHEALTGAGKFVVVEAGGPMVPLTKRYTYADLLRELDLPSVVIARTGRGTLNHCLMTLVILKHLGRPPLGFVLNGFGQYGDGFAEALNPDVLADLAKPTPVLATLEWRPIFADRLDRFIGAVRRQEGLMTVLAQLAGVHPPGHEGSAVR